MFWYGDVNEAELWRNHFHFSWMADYSLYSWSGSLLLKLKTTSFLVFMWYFWDNGGSVRTLLVRTSDVKVAGITPNVYML